MGIIIGVIVVAGSVVGGVAYYYISNKFVCLIDGRRFRTQQQLIDHYQKVHPGVRIPIVIIWS